MSRVPLLGESVATETRMKHSGVPRVSEVPENKSSAKSIECAAIKRNTSRYGQHIWTRYPSMCFNKRLVSRGLGISARRQNQVVKLGLRIRSKAGNNK